MSAHPTFGALEVDQTILRMLGHMLQSEAVLADPDLAEQVGKLMDLCPEIQDEFLSQTPIEGGVLYPATEVKFSFTLTKLGFNFAYESKHAGFCRTACIMLHVFFIEFIYQFIYIHMISVYYLSWLGVFRQLTISFCKEASARIAEYACLYVLHFRR